MPRRKRAAVEQGDGAPVDHHVRLIETMKTLAFRSPKLQPVIMQLARAGGLTEVVKEITRWRTYAKRSQE